VRRIMKLMLPAIFGSSVAQINLLLDTLIASFLVSGSITWLYYSDRLLEFPLGVLGIAIATVILPALSRQHSQDSVEEFNHTLNWAMRLVLVISIPACVGLFVLATPILATLFEYGAFTAHDTQMSSIALTAYSFGLPAFILIKILAPGFFARQDTKTPVRIGIIALISNMVFNILLVVPMVWLDYATPHVGLAIATSMSAWQQAFMLYRKLHAEDVYRISSENIRWLIRAILPLIALTLVLIYSTPEASSWSAMGALERAEKLGLIIISAAATYIVSLIILGIRPTDLKATH